MGILLYNKHMVLLSLVSWWYGSGWWQLAQRNLSWVAGTADFFSIGLLAKTLLAPYRQISVGRVQGAVGVQLRAWFDLQISRVIGAFVRLAVIVCGLIALAVVLFVGFICLLAWPLVPVLPVLTTILLLGSAR